MSTSKSRKRTSLRSVRGFGTRGGVLALLGIALAAMVGYAVYVMARQAYWDSEVQALCTKDGGTEVFEVITLSNEEYSLLLNQFGKLSPPLDSRSTERTPVFHTNKSTYIRRSNPEVRRDEIAVVRTSDKKVLGVSIAYSRVGGDLAALHPSYFSCPEESADIYSATIRKRNGNK